MSDAVDALKQFCRDVASGAYPEVLDALRVRSGTGMNNSTYQLTYNALYVDLWSKKVKPTDFPTTTISSDSISIGTETGKKQAGQALHQDQWRWVWRPFWEASTELIALLTWIARIQEVGEL